MVAVYQWLKPIFARAKALEVSSEGEKIECEFRFGKCNQNYFDTDVGETKYAILLRALQKYPHWDEVVHKNSTCYYQDNLRVEIDDDTEDVTVLDKRTEFCFEYTHLPHYDVRFSVARETRVQDATIPEVVDFMRHKRRVSFLRKNVSIDLTVVDGNSVDKDDETETRYELEVEIVDLSLVSSEAQLFNTLYKLQCILDVLG